MSDKCKTLCSLILSIGIALGGFFPGYYYYRAKSDANFVTVKGLAEMDVKADLGVWDIKYVVTGNDLAVSQSKMTAQQEIITSFLKKYFTAFIVLCYYIREHMFFCEWRCFAHE